MGTVAEKLYEAKKNKQPLKLGELDVTDVETAYKVQDEVIKLKVKAGETFKGYKISMTSDETQALFDSNSPVFGQMTNTQVLDNTISLADFNEPLYEVELVFMVEEDVEATDTVYDVMEKCKVAAGIEVPDGRYENWFPNADLYEVVSDCAVSGGVVFDKFNKYSYEDLADVDARLVFNGEVVKEGNSSEVLGHPAKAVLWLAQALAEQGKKLEAGKFVSSGTFVLPEDLQEGTYKAEYENIGNVTLEVTK